MAGARQTNFLEPETPPVHKGIHRDERPRLTRQSQAILARLQQGPATNVDLMPIAVRYSARIHELRKFGYIIDMDRVDRMRGLNKYTLKGKR